MDPVLLIFAALAAFALFRLISVLGERTGHEQSPDLEKVQRSRRDAASDTTPAEPATANISRTVSEASKPIADVDSFFDEEEYLTGAKAAYEMIVEAFASGDIKSVEPFLDKPVREAFAGAIEARKRAGHEMELKFVGIDSARVASSELRGNIMMIVTEFTSNQVRVTRDSEGAAIEGDPNRIELVHDRWTFVRKVGARDPNWILAATGA